MTASNLSTVLGPNLIYRKNQDVMNMKGDLDMGNSIVETLIDQYAFLFAGVCLSLKFLISFFRMQHLDPPREVRS